MRALSVRGMRPFSDPESRDWRVTPQIHVADLAEEPLRHQPVQRSHTVAFAEGPAYLRLRERHDDAGVILELTTDSGKQASGRHTGSSLRAAGARGAGPGGARSAGEQEHLQCSPVQVVRWRLPCYLRAPVDTPVRLLVVDLDARHLTVMTDLAEEEGIDVRTAVDATGAIDHCRLEYLDLVMINAGLEGESGVSLLEAIRTLRPTVRAILMNGAQVPIRPMLRELRNEPRHVPCVDEFQHIESPAFVLPATA